jgi:hypothetical protein
MRLTGLFVLMFPKPQDKELIFRGETLLLDVHFHEQADEKQKINLVTAVRL